MPEQFVLHEFRSKVDKEYVGVAPNSSSVKPVHIAQAAFRTIDERYWKLSLLKRLALAKYKWSYIICFGFFRISYI